MQSENLDDLIKSLVGQGTPEAKQNGDGVSQLSPSKSSTPFKKSTLYQDAVALSPVKFDLSGEKSHREQTATRRHSKVLAEQALLHFDLQPIV